MIYIVLLPPYDKGFIPVPYTTKKHLAYKYARDHFLRPETVIEMGDDEFEQYEIISPYHAYEIDEFNGIAMIWDEVEEVSGGMDDLTFSAANELISLAGDLKYFKGKDVEEVRTAIQKLIKTLKNEANQAPESQSISVALFDRLKKRKFSKHYLETAARDSCAAYEEDEE